jgi:hypothetical protein
MGAIMVAHNPKGAVSIEELPGFQACPNRRTGKAVDRKGFITEKEFQAKIFEQRAVYQRLLNQTRH